MHAGTAAGVRSGETTVCRIFRCRTGGPGPTVSLFTKIVWDDLRRELRAARELRSTPGTPGSKFAGGHRMRVTPVPIPNTEVKPHTADGTAWETVWESRSLPALFAWRKARSSQRRSGFFRVLQRRIRRPRRDVGLMFAPCHSSRVSSLFCQIQDQIQDQILDRI